MLKAKVYMHTVWAGTLVENEDGYHYQYEPSYLARQDAEAISLTLPLKAGQVL